MRYDIMNLFTKLPIVTAEADTLKKALETIVQQRANLGGADLEVANLRDANLRDANLGGANLRRANLRGANLGGANLRDADLRDANLRGANLRDAKLGDADLRDANLRGANLRDANLRGADLRRANLRGANLGDANLRDANLRDANLRGANLRGAYLGDADLRGANLRGAYLGDVPVVANLHRQILAALESGGTLDMTDWHRCETTHCRAGWAIHLAGAAGYALEYSVGPAVAGAFISIASSPALEGLVPNFVVSADEALADIRSLAALETNDPITAVFGEDRCGL